MEVNKTLYKKDTKGKIRTLKITTDNGLLTQESGVLGGKTVVHESVSKPKNIGRANETTSAEQARLEAESKLKKKLDEGYFETQKEAENTEVILPMLAKDFEKEKHKIQYPCYIQPKLDGMRAIGVNGLTSRGGKPITTLKHIENAIQNIGVKLDGELYAHGLSFQENMKIIKKYRKGRTEQVKFHVYDIISDDNFYTRLWKLQHRVKDIPEIEVVPTYMVNNEKEVKEWHDKFVLEGYEGAIVRWGSEPYKVKGRSSSLLKVKQFIDIDAEIVDVEPSDKNPEQGVVICQTDKGRFGCGMKVSHADREEILKNKDNYIGKLGNIRFFEYTDDGLPRFPVFIGIHGDR